MPSISLAGHYVVEGVIYLRQRVVYVMQSGVGQCPKNGRLNETATRQWFWLPCLPRKPYLLHGPS